MSTLREADCSLSGSSSTTAVRCRVSPATASTMTRCAAALIASGLQARCRGAGGESFNKREVPWKVTGTR
jgi:hypothetical protein